MFLFLFFIIKKGLKHVITDQAHLKILIIKMLFLCAKKMKMVRISLWKMVKDELINSMKNTNFCVSLYTYVFVYVYKIFYRVYRLIN